MADENMNDDADEDDYRVDNTTNNFYDRGAYGLGDIHEGFTDGVYYEEDADTEFEDYLEKSLDEIIGQVEHLSKNSNKIQSIFLVVITGGEPFRQPIYGLCHKLLQLNYKVQIETNGTLYQDLPDGIDIICSPKVTNSKYHNIREELLPKITAFKYIISANIA
ncbi:MAG: hypothetical protein EB127_31570, partial [Alphaproteobacteria bacterium]|nr:hypothetical protein [Alphaproteobacteria bacterium]